MRRDQQGAVKGSSRLRTSSPPSSESGSGKLAPSPSSETPRALLSRPNNRWANSQMHQRKMHNADDGGQQQDLSPPGPIRGSPIPLSPIFAHPHAPTACDHFLSSTQPQSRIQQRQQRFRRNSWGRSGHEQAFGRPPWIRSPNLDQSHRPQRWPHAPTSTPHRHSTLQLSSTAVLILLVLGRLGERLSVAMSSRIDQRGGLVSMEGWQTKLHASKIQGVSSIATSFVSS